MQIKNGRSECPVRTLGERQDRADQQFPEVSERKGWRLEDWASSNVLYDVIADTRHFTFTQTYEMHSIKANPNVDL